MRSCHDSRRAGIPRFPERRIGGSGESFSRRTRGGSATTEKLVPVPDYVNGRVGSSGVQAD